MKKPDADKSPSRVPKTKARPSAIAIHTSQEIDVLERSACDGYTGNGWQTDEQRQARHYETPNGSHYVQIQLLDGDIDGGLSLAALESLTAAQDADSVFAMLYICSMLTPPEVLPENRAAIEWIDLDDVMEHIGWYPKKRSLAERDAMRARVWDFIVFCHRAKVVGRRTRAYRDRYTKQEIETEVGGPIWRVMNVERPVQGALMDEVPRRVQIVISKEWEALLTDPRLAQYLPLGELLGAIPPDKVAGDWARSIGLALASRWRRKPHEALSGGLSYSRRELLSHYTPKKRTVDAFLSDDNRDPKRDVKYWHEAVSTLVERGLIACEGEAARSVAALLKEYSGYGWREKWIDEKVVFYPGEKWQQSIQQRAAAKFIKKPVALEGKKRRKVAE